VLGCKVQFNVVGRGEVIFSGSLFGGVSNGEGQENTSTAMVLHPESQKKENLKMLNSGWNIGMSIIIK